MCLECVLLLRIVVRVFMGRWGRLLKSAMQSWTGGLEQKRAGLCSGR